ncbi:hypothetical protein DPMN_091355 [Dreissena polymorpha]|uniref:Uncharacterized protein n=1 Tax=Dreissena polymorpha TaxID=45954 RepID=A0A9D4R0M8_DREPO|nr:hypothetical protein DPMN_091355 [Dreissena polymorpha]
MLTPRIMKLHRYIDHDWQMTPMDFQSCDFTTIIPIKPRSGKRFGSGRIEADPSLNREILQIMVFISTVLRCPNVKRASNTLLLRCYADR